MKAEVRLENNRLYVRTPFAPALVQRLQAIPGRRWHQDTKENSFPIVKDVVMMVCDVCGVLPWTLPPEVQQAVGRTAHEQVERVALDLAAIDSHHFHTDPYAHQRVNLARLVQHDRWLLADEMGTGKTHALANAVLWHRLRERGLKTLIVCPKSVLGTWQQQFRLHVGLVCQTTGPNQDPWLRPPAAALAVNYEYLHRHPDTFLLQDFDILILDEIHKVKNFTAKATKAVRQLSAKARWVYGASGTPWPNGLEDSFGVLSCIDPKLLVDDFGGVINTKAAFDARYCVKQRTMKDKDGKPTGPLKVVGYRNVEELHGFVCRVTSRVTKAECLDLPEKVFITRTVTLGGEQARVYRELKKDAVARLKPLWERTAVGKMTKAMGQPAVNARSVSTDLAQKLAAFVPELDPDDQQAVLTVNNVLTESLRLLQVVGGFVPDDDGNVHELPDKAKVEALVDVIDEAGAKQVVVWCAFVEEVYWLAEFLAKKYKAKVSVLTGRISSGTVRQEMIDKFTAGESRFFVGTAAAGGLGINGLQVADVEVYYSRDWNLATYLQSQDRLHRIGQKNRVTVARLVAAGTVDRKVDESLERKAALQEMLLTNPEELF